MFTHSIIPLNSLLNKYKNITRRYFVIIYVGHVWPPNLFLIPALYAEIPAYSFKHQFLLRLYYNILVSSS